MKSWAVADMLICFAHIGYERIGCFRELQNSIKDSVHKLLKDRIEALGLSFWFEVTRESITSLVPHYFDPATGRVVDSRLYNSAIHSVRYSEFLFKGLQRNTTEIKSMEGITKAWVEEAQLVSKDSWELLIPTIRAMGSEIWITFNPDQEDDDTYQRWVVTNDREDSVVLRVGWEDNPWFPPALEAERLAMLKKDPETYEHIWGGHPKKLTEAIIFKDCYDLAEWELPERVEWRFGADFGFANDPATLVKFYITGTPPTAELWIWDEIGEVGVETDHLPLFYKGGAQTFKDSFSNEYVKSFRGLVGSDEWPIGADCARPETISYVARQGFRIFPAEKWSGSVEDGIATMKSFLKIHIHKRCVRTAREFRLYSYKIDPKRVDAMGKPLVLPVIVDAYNHYIDAIRYGLDGYIQRRGVVGQWLKLAEGYNPVPGVRL